MMTPEEERKEKEGLAFSYLNLVRWHGYGLRRVEIGSETHVNPPFGGMSYLRDLFILRYFF
jgi:hypothetical protein